MLSGKLSLLFLGILTTFTFQNCGEVGFQSETSLEDGSNQLMTTGPDLPDILPNDSFDEDTGVTADNGLNDRSSEDEQPNNYNDPKTVNIDRGLEDISANLNDFYIDLYSCSNGHGKKKVNICHVPPGNPEARQTLCIALPALKTHLHHRCSKSAGHDHLGACEL